VYISNDLKQYIAIERRIMTDLVSSAMLSPNYLSPQIKQASLVVVKGQVKIPMTPSQEGFATMKQSTVSALCKNGTSHIYTGVLLVDVLDSAGVTLGDKLDNKRLTRYILVTSADGYQAVFPLTEVERSIKNHNILVAFLRDGMPLQNGEGPFRIISPDDKKRSRWVRQIHSIEMKLAE
jgi:hypothetical protein